ncbi:MAG: TyrR family helix-turn-helix protein [Candidatus Endobugula sp.]|jgi:transcriptional regulator of aroF, aroG, tyrA and aromatic amino acid transport
MKIELIGKNRFGITQEVLTVMTEHQLELASMEVSTGHIYIDVPHLTEYKLPLLSSALANIQGLKAINMIELLPNERRRFHLDTLLANFPDPLFTIDASGAILSANAAAATPLGLAEIALEGIFIKDILDGDYDVAATSPQQKQLQEVTLAGQPYLLELQLMHSIHSGTTTNTSQTSHSHGEDNNHQPSIKDCMLILHTPTRVGHHISKVQMGNIKGLNTIAGQSAAMLQVKSRAQQFASVHAPLLIQGETGTGKELFARAVHQISPWSSAAFLALNCAALPENLVESELFGYASGAFSGATRDGKPGLLELADGGTVFLDEIGEMSTYVQAKLLRFVQDGTFLRVGGKKEHKINVRIICATHRNLEQLVQEGRFREDLMYRLNVLNLTLPSLRERPDDIVDLATLFVARAANQIGCHTPNISKQAKTLLASYSWPGNVRQLENLLFRTIAMNQNKTIDVDDLHLIGIAENPTNNKAEPENWKTAQAEFEKNLLTRLYKHYPSTRKLAKRLEVSHTTIADKLRAYGITL